MQNPCRSLASTPPGTVRPICEKKGGSKGRYASATRKHGSQRHGGGQHPSCTPQLGTIPRTEAEGSHLLVLVPMPDTLQWDTAHVGEKCKSCTKSSSRVIFFCGKCA